MTEGKRGDTTPAQAQHKAFSYTEELVIEFLSSNNERNIAPPGCYATIGPPNLTPGYKNSSVPVAAMFEHRFAFYYWALWARETLTSEESNDSFFRRISLALTRIATLAAIAILT